MPSWPETLPAPQWQGFQAEFQDNVIRSQMDSGPGKLRRRFSAAAMYYPVTWMFTRPQLQEFYNWFVDEVFSGSISFSWTHPITGLTVIARFRKPPSIKPVSDQVLKTVIAGSTTVATDGHFGNRATTAGQPSHSIEGLWQVNGEIEVLP